MLRCDDEVLFTEVGWNVVSITNIQKRLDDLLAKDSKFLYMPEEQPKVWSFDVPKLTPWQKQRFNYYRKRVGLPEVKFD